MAETTSEAKSTPKPAATAAMILGILSIFFSFTLIGLILALMARVKARKLLADAASGLDVQSLEHAKVARHTSTASIVLSILWLVVLIVVLRG